jgi:Lactonase, 7-bladed beta-propeller
MSPTAVGAATQFGRVRPTPLPARQPRSRSRRSRSRRSRPNRGVPDQPQNRCASPQADRDGDDWKRRKLDRDRAERQERLRGDQHQRGLAVHDQHHNRQAEPKEARDHRRNRAQHRDRPNGKNAYVIGATSRGVSQYRINPRTGKLSFKPVSTAATVLHPETIAIAPNDESAYVTSENDGKVSQYNINPTTGNITPMTPATVVTASGSLGLAVTP